ncbi:substrate-binding periplasmic protein [Agarivorans sp. MS3-6]
MFKNLSLAVVLLTASSALKATESVHFAAIEHLFEQKVGIAVLNTVYNKLGISLKVSSLPAKRAQSAAVNGLVDGEVMRVWSYGEQTANMIRVPTPYYSLESTAFYLSTKKASVATLSDLSNCKVAIVRGVKHSADLTATSDKVVELDSTDKALGFMLKQRADLVLTNKLDGIVALQRMGVEKQVSYSRPLAFFPLYHYIHESRAELVPLVDEELKKLIASGEVAQIILQTELQLQQAN